MFIHCFLTMYFTFASSASKKLALHALTQFNHLMQGLRIIYLPNQNKSKPFDPLYEFDFSPTQTLCFTSTVIILSVLSLRT